MVNYALALRIEKGVVIRDAWEKRRHGNLILYRGGEVFPVFPDVVLLIKGLAL